MDLIGGIPLIGPILVGIVPFLVVLSIVVAVHELGHLLVGRWCGIRAEVFSIGFGKVLWSRTDRLGTRWQLAALPLGGYVKFLGDMDPASAGKLNDAELHPAERRHAFHNAVLWRRALTVLAGPVANFLLSLVLFFALGLASEKPSDAPVIASIHPERQEDVVGLEAGDRVLRVDGVETATFAEVIDALSRTNGAPTELVVERGGQTVDIEARYVSPPIVTGLIADGAAIGAGIRPNDRLLEIDGTSVNSAREVQLAIADLPPGQPVTFKIRRDGEVIDLTFTPKLRERMHPETGELEEIPFLGIAMQDVGVEPIMVPSTRRRRRRIRGAARLADRRRHGALHQGDAAARRRHQPALGPDRHRQALGGRGQPGRAAVPVLRRLRLDGDRPAEPLPDPGAGWRAPGLLPRRGDQGKAEQRDRRALWHDGGPLPSAVANGLRDL